MQLALLSLFLLVAAGLLVRASNREKREYGRFKRLTGTRERQFVLRKWLRESFLVFASLSALILLAAFPFVQPAATDALRWAPLAMAAVWLRGDAGTAVAIGGSILLLAVMVVPVLLLRRQLEELPMIGDVGALLPRTRGELPLAAGLALNAGVFEELLFRLGMPALLFGITRNGLVAFALAIVLFGLLHLYQGPAGVIGATVLGIVFTAIYLLSGSIVAVMILHAAVDLRSLVLIPLVVKRVWRTQ